MSAVELRTRKERSLFKIMAVASALLWTLLIVGTLGIGLIYGLFIGGFILVAHAMFLAHVSGNGVRISERQLPELHAKIVRASQKLGLDTPPEAYILQSGGALNAFATKLFSRRFIILFSELLDACDTADSDEAAVGEIDFIIAHEIGHLAAGHLAWNSFLMPAQMLPWLGTAYSRAREYTCDQCGFAFVGDLEKSSRALALLAAGGRYGRRINLDTFVAQGQSTGSFWMAVYELNSTHPYLPKRIAALRETAHPGSTTVVARSAAAYIFSPIFGFAGGGAAMMVPVMMIGIVAALAIPAFTQYVKESKEIQASAAAASEDDELSPEEYDEETQQLLNELMPEAGEETAE